MCLPDDALGDFLDADDVQVFAGKQFMDGRDGEDAVETFREDLLDAPLARVVHL